MFKKRWNALLLALVIVFSLAPAVMAYEETELPGKDEYIDSMASFDGEVLLLATDYLVGTAIYRYDGEAMKEIARYEGTTSLYESISEEELAASTQRITRIIAGDDGIYGYAQYGHQMYKWNGSAMEAFGAPLTGMEWDYTVGSKKRTLPLEAGAVAGGKFFASFMGTEEADYTPTLMSFDLQSGEGTKLDIEGMDYISGCAPYKDSKVLLCYQDQDNDYRMVLRGLDMKTGALDAEALIAAEGYNAGGLVYHAAQDTVYYYDQGSINKIEAGAAVPVAYPPLDYVRQGVLLGEKYLLSESALVYEVALDGSEIPETVLRVQDGYADKAYRTFIKENPGVGIVFPETWYSGSEEIASAIQTGEDSIDIFSIYISDGWNAVKEKGYAQSLSASKAISDAVADYYPGYKDAITGKDGDIYGVYQHAYLQNQPMINTMLWEEVGLTEADYPTTYGELIDLLLRWEEEYAEEYPEYMVTSHVEKSSLRSWMLEAYVMQCEASGEVPSFNSPMLREVLEKIEALPWEEIDWDNMSDSDYDDLNERYCRSQLLHTGGNAFSEGTIAYPEGKYHVLLPLVFEAGQTPVLRAAAQVFFVNPESPNVDLAIQYMETRVRTADEGASYMLTPTLNEPVRLEDYETQVKDMEKGRDEMIEQQKDASDEDKADYQGTIDYYNYWLEHKEENQWRISAEAIARYREIAPYTDLLEDSVFLVYDGDAGSGLSQLSDVIERYNGGQLDLDSFLREMDQKAKMISLEGR